MFDESKQLSGALLPRLFGRTIGLDEVLLRLVRLDYVRNVPKRLLGKVWSTNEFIGFPKSIKLY